MQKSAKFFQMLDAENVRGWGSVGLRLSQVLMAVRRPRHLGVLGEFDGNGIRMCKAIDRL